MRLLLISGAYPPTRAGEADHAYMIAKHLAARGVDVRVLTTAGTAPSNNDKPTVSRAMRRWSWSELPRLLWILWRHQPDVVLLMYIGWIYDAHPMITFLPTIAKFVRRRTRCVTQFENALGSEPYNLSRMARGPRKAFAVLLGPRRVNYQFGTLLHDSDAIVVLSVHHRHQLSAANRVDAPVTLIPPPPLLPVAGSKAARPEGRRRLGLRDDEFLIAYFGYVYPRKGLETLGSAFRRVLDARPDVKLAIIGGPLAGEEAHYAKIQDLYKELGISASVTWTGFLEDTEELAMYLAAADLCAHPIDIGVQLNNSSFAAAAASGLPIVATRGPQLEAPFVNGYNALLCPPKDPVALAGAIEAVINDPVLKERLARGALALAREWFSWEGAIDRLMSVLTTSADAVQKPSTPALGESPVWAPKSEEVRK